MQVALKVWRYDAATGDRALREYEIDAPEEATLLDCLDIVKDRHDGTLAYRKSCRMMICGSCGMRMDGAAVLACKTRMYDIAQAGHAPVFSSMGNLPIVKDLVVDMDPFWQKFNSVDPYLRPGYAEAPDGREHLIRTPIAELAAQLDPSRFWQVHRSTLINLDHLESTRRDEASRLWLRLRGHAHELPVSRAYVHLFKAM